MRAMDFKFSEKKDDRFIITRIEFKPPSSISPYSFFFIQTKFPLIHNELGENMTYICMYLTLSSELF